MQIIGHRGARGLAQENTINAIDKALECNVDGIEIDIRVWNNQLVLSHDETHPEGKYTLLSEALQTVAAKVPIILEIKEQVVVDLLKSELQNYHGKITFSSKKYNKYDILRDVKKLFPDHDIAVTEGWTSVRAIALASILETNEIHLNQQWLWSGFIRSMKHRGYKIIAYTVNNPERAQELAEWGVDGVITDYPDRLVNTK